MLRRAMLGKGERTSGGFAVLWVAALAVLTAASPAAATPATEAVSDPDPGLTRFKVSDLGPSPCEQQMPCRAQITVKRSGRIVYSRATRVGREREFFNPITGEPDTYVGEDFDYRWSCKRTGRHSWTVVYTGGDASSPAPSDSGSFTVQRCGRTKYRVSQGRAAAAAAKSGYGQGGNDFVSRARCRSQPQGRRRAADWLCRVTHSNNFRECVTITGVHYFRKVTFGQAEITNSLYDGRRRCRYF